MIQPRRFDLVAAFVLGVPVFLLSVVVAVLSVPGTRAVVLVAACLVAHVAFVFRRDLRGFAVIGAAMGVQAAVTGLFMVLPTVVLFPLALFSCTAYGRPYPPLVLGVAGAGLAAARFATDESVAAARLGPNPWLLLGLLLAVVAAAWGFGLYRRTQLGYLALLKERAAMAATQATLAERARIAREMHDVVAHALAVIVAQARGGRLVPGRAPEVLATVEETGRQALTEMRGLVGVLRAEPDELAPQPGLADLPGLLDRTRAAGLTVALTTSGTARRIGPGAELALYRVVQEALTNTLKHGGAGAASSIGLSWTPSALEVTVTDDGRGRAATTAPGHGLAGMRERMAAVGGTVHAGAAGERGERGFAVKVRLPYQEGVA
ncbi:histidine kinase [Nonomuraea sp. NBC_01738]|uniref:sensor histidine kinase n=1 Tax=Nonomuraea sp. NBC_01738 TaxID=2976003 RepID=UPI002E11F366|nr:histidine kinase [Nonomuraea sp. NBC_01738]